MKLFCRLFHWPWHRATHIHTFHNRNTGLFMANVTIRCLICGQWTIKQRES